MWKRGGRSSALDRAQVLLSAKRSSRGDVQGSTQDSAATAQGCAGGSVKARSAPPNTHPLFSDLSDLSSVSSAPDQEVDAIRSANAEKNREREGDSNKDLRPQSSLGGRGSRFLKKAPPTAKQQPVSTDQMQQVPEPRYVTSSQRGSQAAALSRLAEIESRIRTQAQEQARQGTKPVLHLTSDLGISSPPPAAQSPEAPVQRSVRSSGDQSLRGNRFLKSKAAGDVESTNAAPARAQKSADVGVRARSRAAYPEVSSGGLETESGRVMSGVSLESDEEDMRKLLGDSMDSTDNSFSRPRGPSSMKKPDKMFSKSSQRLRSTPPPAAIRPLSPSSTAPPRSPASPFRFTGQPQAHFNPSALSPSPSPPCLSLSSPERPCSSHRAESPQRSLSSMSGRGEVLSLEELFPVGPGSEDPHSEMSSVSSEDFKINVMTLDDLVPATPGFTVETPGKERETKHGTPVPESPEEEDEQQQLQQEEEGMLDYRSDFESESRTEPDYSASQISEHLHGDREEEEVASEVREEASHADVSRGGTEDDYSSAFSDNSRSCTSRTSNCRRQTSKTRSGSRSRDSRSSVSDDSRTSSQMWRRRASGRKILKEAAVQTQPDPLASTWSGVAAVSPAVGMTYINPSPVVTHAVSADMVEAISSFNPAAFALNEILKQQLAMTRRFIESSRHLHSSLLQSLEPPNYRYTTLKDTKEYIRRCRPPKPRKEEVLKEAL